MPLKVRLLALSGVFFWMSTFEGSAKDLGVQGKTFDIAEESLLEVIQNRLRAAEKSGKLEDFKEEMIQRAKKSLARPKALKLPRAQSHRRFYYDPSVVLGEDIKDHKGRIVAAKGTRMNPLDHLSFGAPLLFLDSDDDAQVIWARKQEKNAKWVLTKGAPFKVMEEEGREVFFDQGGALVKKFGIKALPSKVSQKEKLLLVEKVALDETET